MKKERKKDVREMAEITKSAIDGQKALDAGKFPAGKFPFEKGMEGITRSKVDPNKAQDPDKIIATKKLEIPKCLSLPVNGRIYVISVAGDDMKTAGGLILPPSLAAKKNEEVEGVRRYFAVAWDKDDIPKSILEKLSVGIELYPFLPMDAYAFHLPRVVDWMGNNIFEVLHWSELAGISAVKPEKVEK